MAGIERPQGSREPVLELDIAAVADERPRGNAADILYGCALMRPQARLQKLLPASAQGRVKLNQRLCLCALNVDEVQLRRKQVRIGGKHFKITG